MNEQEKFNRFRKRYPIERPNFFERPHVSRRRFFQAAAAGVSGSFLLGRHAWGQSAHSNPAAKNTAQNVIFIFLRGAPSHVDTFDFKMTDGVTPSGFAPETINGIQWPTGLLPKLGGMLGDFAIVRSMQAHALVHGLGEMWMQIGRNPAGPLGNIAPNIGSVVAIEKDPERQPGQTFPTFIAFDSAAMGSGYFAEKYGPFRLAADSGGIANLANPAGDARFQKRWNLLHALDDNLRINSPDGVEMENYDGFYNAAHGLMDNPIVTSSFNIDPGDSMRYGKSALGNACLLAYQVLKARQGTRFIQISSTDGWDMHYGIYSPNTGLPAKGPLLDNAVSALLGDLKASGMLASTLVVMFGEFGRTTGALSPQGGRDHYVQQFAFFAGGGVKGGTVIGSTDALGSDVVDYGWSRQRYVYIEDVEATIYSALGIDWTYIRPDDPIHRGFEYVPFSEEDLYGPVHELWG